MCTLEEQQNLHLFFIVYILVLFLFLIIIMFLMYYIRGGGIVFSGDFKSSLNAIRHHNNG